jgi:hypothetical protein
MADKYLQDHKQKDLKIPILLMSDKINTAWQQLPMNPQTSNINTYEKLF